MKAVFLIVAYISLWMATLGYLAHLVRGANAVRRWLTSVIRTNERQEDGE